MTAVTEGIKSPQIELLDTKDRGFNLQEALKTNGVCVLAFYKAGCPVCQMTAPYLEKLAKLNPTLALYAVSQDNLEETKAFIAEYRLTFPVLLDKDLKFTRKFELTNVPSIFVIKTGMLVDKSIVGFSKDDLEYIHRLTGTKNKENLFSEKDDVPPFRPG